MTTTKWTPYDCLAVAELTESGLLDKTSSPNEIDVILLSTEPIELRSAVPTEPLVPLVQQVVYNNDGTKTNTITTDTTKKSTDWYYKECNLEILLTTHRFVFFKTVVGTKKRTARYLHLSNIFTMECETAYFKSPKLLLSTAIGDLVLAFPKSSNATKLRDELYKNVQLTIQRKIWEKDVLEKKTTTTTTTSALSSSSSFSSATRRKVGVDAIVSNVTTRHQQAATLTDTAFQGDIETLLQEATELVKIIHKYVATLERSNSNTNDDTDGGTGENNSADKQRFLALLSDMGMTSSIVNKSDYGKSNEKAYYIELARQIADYLRPKFRTTAASATTTASSRTINRRAAASSSSSSSTAAGVVTVTEAYCYYNRARGTNLISPEDFMKACEQLETVSTGIKLYTFPTTGLKVLQDTSIINTTVLYERFIDLLHNLQTDNITALDVSQTYGIPTYLAYEQLQQIEQLGKLVRDETLECTRFYNNEYFV